MQAKIDKNRQASDKKIKTHDSKLDKLTALIKKMTDHNQNLNSFTDKMDSPKSEDLNTVVPSRKKYPSLESGNSKKIVGMWNLKHEIFSPNFYELLI